MKAIAVIGLCSALGLNALIVRAQETNQIESVNQRLKQLQEQFEQQQRQMRQSFERMVQQQQAEIEALKKKVAEMQAAAAPVPAPTNTMAGATATNMAPAVSAEEVKDLKERVDELEAGAKRSPINQFNPGIGFVVDTIFSYTSTSKDETAFTRGHRPGGFDADLRTAELNLEASVDPFAKAYGVISASADARTGEATMEVEEASAVTTSLPGHLTVQGGRFFAEFGRLAYVHDHDLPFVFRPLVLDRYIGGESRTDGAQVNYLFPTEHFISLTVGLGNGFGANAGPTPTVGYRSLAGVSYWGRLSTYFDLTPNLNLETGISGVADSRANGLATDPTQRDRFIGGTDITLRYQPLSSSVYRGVVWGTEVLYNSANFETDPGIFNRERSVGLYSYVETKLSRQFKGGFLFDWLEDPANNEAVTYRYSPYVTWNPSEFQLLRLQYSRTQPSSATGFRPSDGVYLQWTAIIGRHVHGFKQR
jgi:hypothetical protein